jgi:hypothetical protein
MKIKMLTSIAGADFALSPGAETERFSEAEAGRLVAAGYAEEVAAEPAPAPVVEPVVIETGAVAPVETATPRRKK